ncbi:CidA/LrgA family protein [bacterium]|nr:CidA/LrgA family protein [bacterium]
MKTIVRFVLGLLILMGFYYISSFVVKLLNIPLAPAILGLILFSFALVEGLIKEEWIQTTCDCLIKNMAMFIVPFMGGLVLYKHMLVKNWFVILIVIFVTTTITIVVTGLFVEYGLKYLRLYRKRKNND